MKQLSPKNGSKLQRLPVWGTSVVWQGNWPRRVCRVWAKEVDWPYRHGAGIAIVVFRTGRLVRRYVYADWPITSLVVQFGVCRRRAELGHPDDQGDYDDDGVVAAVEARLLTSDIDEIDSWGRA